MDPGTALAIVTIVCDTAETLYRHYTTLKTAGKDIEALQTQLKWLQDTFAVLKQSLQDPEGEKEVFDLVGNALTNCREASQELQEILTKINGKKAQFAFRKSTVIAIAENVATCRDALHLAVSVMGNATAERVDNRVQGIMKMVSEAVTKLDSANDQLHTIQADTTLLKGRADEIYELTEEFKTTQASRDREQKKKAIAEWICPNSDSSRQLLEAYGKRADGTCQWFLDSFEFRRWVAGRKRRMFCPGDPGTGKTVLAATVVDHLLQTVSPTRKPVLYVFCNHLRQSEQSVDYVLSTLLSQLTTSLDLIPSSIQKIYDAHWMRGVGMSRETMKRVFKGLTTSPRCIYVIIDGLDECSKFVRTSILANVCEVFHRAQLCLLVTSRWTSDIETAIQADTVLSIRSTEEDICRYLRQRIVELSSIVTNNRALQERVISTIATEAQGVFLLSRLHMDSLRSKRTVKSINDALHQLPKGSNAYDDSYRFAMARICDQSNEDARVALEALAWITRAQKYLSVSQLLEALAIENGSTSLETDNLMDIDELLSLCVGLVVRDKETDVLQLVHLTAHEYLTRTLTQWMKNADETLAFKCMTYLSFEQFSVGPCEEDVDLSDRLLGSPLYEYAAQSWGNHLSDALKTGNNEDALAETALALLNNKYCLASTCQAMSLPHYRTPGFAKDSLRETSAVHIAVKFGLVDLMERLIGEDSPNVQDSGGRTPLSIACELGHEEVLSNLLKRTDIEPDLSDAKGHTPLVWAAENGHIGTVRLLIATGKVDVNYKDKDTLTPFWWAVKSGSEEMVKFFLGIPEVDFGSMNKLGQTPLLWAAASGQENVVQLLIDCREVEIDTRDKFGQTPLWWAAHNGHVRVVDVLLETRAPYINNRDEDGQTALMAAEANGNEAVANRLRAAMPKSLPPRHLSPPHDTRGGFQVREKQWFYPNRVIEISTDPSAKRRIGISARACSSPELVEDRKSRNVYQSPRHWYGEEWLLKNRFLIVMEHLLESCLCIPVVTFHGKGISKRGDSDEDFAIAYCRETGPPRVPAYRPHWRLQTPIRISLDGKEKELPENTRIDYGRLFEVPLTSPAKSIGSIHTKSEKDFDTACAALQKRFQKFKTISPIELRRMEFEMNLRYHFYPRSAVAISDVVSVSERSGGDDDDRNIELRS